MSSRTTLELSRDLRISRTECGALSNFLPGEQHLLRRVGVYAMHFSSPIHVADIIGADWEYFSFPKHLNIKLEPCGPDQCECIILVSNESNLHSLALSGKWRNGRFCRRTSIYVQTPSIRKLMASTGMRRLMSSSSIRARRVTGNSLGVPTIKSCIARARRWARSPVHFTLTI